MIAIETTIEIGANPASVWARLCDARMPTTAPCEFRLGPFGPPQPVRCELPTGAGGIGQERRCVTARGAVTQRITAWTDLEHLAFEMVAEDAGLDRHVSAVRDDFLLTPLTSGRTKLTRRTSLEPRGPCPWLRGVALRFAIQRVHRFTMRGFAAAAIS